jgi:hypothetical protein
MHIEILMPILNDWASVEEVIGHLDRAFASSSDSVSIFLVDDGSTIAPPVGFGRGSHGKLREISILRLKNNMGHQRAIAVGLCYLAEKITCDSVLVMDGDGEDVPADAVRLVERMKQSVGPTIVFAERTRRSESITFRCGYFIYRVLHIALIGRDIRVGNFSAVPAAYLERLAIEPMLWNHYAASIMRSRLPVDRVPTERGSRINGQSHLDFVSLTIHGLSALACYSEIIGVRLILFSGVLVLLAIAAQLILFGLGWFGGLRVSAWTSILLGLVFLAVLQIATLVCNFTMQIISLRSAQSFLPARDYTWFVSSFRRLEENTEGKSL